MVKTLITGKAVLSATVTVSCVFQPQSDLMGLIQILTIVFGEEPPVFARSQAPARPPYPPQTGGSNLPYPAAGTTLTHI